MKVKNILLVNPRQNHPTQSEMYPSGALVLLGTMLHNLGHNIKIVHMVADGVGPRKLGKIISSFEPDVVGVTMSTFQTKSAKEITKLVKEVNKDILVVVGGPHPSSLKLKILEDFPLVDVVVVGEGEHTFLEIVEGKDLNEIKGICYENKINPARPLAQDLDYIPLPNLDLVGINKFIGDPISMAHPAMFTMASRGCPYHCIFCNKSVWGNTARFRKPELVIDEIRWLHERYGIKEIYFQDDTFNLNRRWAEEVLNLIIDNGLNEGIVYKTSFRANEKLIDEELLRLAVEAGFWGICCGIESGNQGMLDMMKKDLAIGEIRRLFELGHQVGLKVMPSFIIGLPSETKETINDSVALWRELKPYQASFGPAIPFPNTEFHSIAVEKNHLLVSDYDEYCQDKFVVRTDSLTKEDLEYCFESVNRILMAEYGWSSLKGAISSPYLALKIIIDSFANPKRAARRLKSLWKIIALVLPSKRAGTFEE